MVCNNTDNMPPLVVCLRWILLALAAVPAIGLQQEAIFFLPYGLQCNTTNTSHNLQDSMSVTFMEDSAQIFPFRFEETDFDLCIGLSVVNQTVVVFSSYAEEDQVGLGNISSEDLGAGMIGWTIYESNPATVVQVCCVCWCVCVCVCVHVCMVRVCVCVLATLLR